MKHPDNQTTKVCMNPLMINLWLSSYFEDEKKHQSENTKKKELQFATIEFNWEMKMEV